MVKPKEKKKNQFRQSLCAFCVLSIMGTTNKCEMGMLLSNYVESSWRGETTSPERQAGPSDKPVGFHPLRLLRVRGYLGGLPAGGSSGGLRDYPGGQIPQLTLRNTETLQGFIRDLLPVNSDFHL